MNTEPSRHLVFCRYCDQWGMEEEFSVSTMIVGGVVRQVLYHTVSFFEEFDPVTHMANWREDFK